MAFLPQHKASQYSDFGMRLRRINSPASPHAPAMYAHQDDYYIFGLVESGTGVRNYRLQGAQFLSWRYVFDSTGAGSSPRQLGIP